MCSCVRLRSRAGADDARIRGMCASAARSLCSAIDGTSTYTGYVYTTHACIYIHARLATPTNGSPMRGPPHTRAPRAASVRACACARVIGRTHPRRHIRARSVGVDRGRLGSQAFYYASAFNANIGAWNTASVTTLASVCAALSGPGGAPPRAGRARPGRRCGGGRCARWDRRCARACVCADMCARACTGVHVCRYSCA